MEKMSSKLNHLYLGDCVEILKSSIENKSIDMIFADPPYNLSGNNLEWKGNQTGGDWYKVNEDWDSMPESEYLEFTNIWVSECARVLNESGAFYIACSYHNMGESIMALKMNGLTIRNIITWHKINTMPNMTKRVFTHASEFVIWATKGKNWTFNYEKLKEINPEKQKDGSLKQMRDVWALPLVQGKERIKGDNGRSAHPTQKPEEMLKRIITASSNEGDVILDPFMGSGTTAYMAQSMNRKWIGIEQSKQYYDICLKRLSK